VPAARVPSGLEEAAALYRSLLDGRRMLVLLDNARDFAQVRPLLPGRPGCGVLVTCRDRMSVPGAYLLTLDPLTPDESLTLLTRDSRDDRDGPLDRLVQVCGGLPLALRIAAGSLARGESLRDPRAGVKAVFDHSYRSLPAEARRLLRLLGLLPGPEFRADAAAALAHVPVGRAEHLIGLLVAARLVEMRRSGWYGMHDLLQLYARERAYGEDPQEARDAAQGALLDHLHTAQLLGHRPFPGISNLAE
jgi:hypothetical protein